MSGAGGRTGNARLRLLGATALVCLAVHGALPPAIALAQDMAALADGIPPGTRMLIEADTLVYNRDEDTISAIGGVRIEYGGNRLVAQRVTYFRLTGRLVASGNVEIIERSGSIIRAAEIDVTDDFRDGFRQRAPG